MTGTHRPAPGLGRDPVGSPAHGPVGSPVHGPVGSPAHGPVGRPVHGPVDLPGRGPDAAGNPPCHGSGGSAPDARASRTPVVELRNVVKEYAGGVRALDGVHLTVEEGELLGIVGPSGSGKSTLLHIVGTLDRPTTGTVAIAGHDIAALADRKLSALRARHIGFVFQAFHLAPGVTAVDNVAEGLLYSGLPRARRRALAAEALARVGLADRARHRPHELSGGQKQRVAIARAIVGQPDLLLADEPTGALDTASGEAVVELLHSLNREGATIAVITHDTEIAQRLPRRVRIRDGRVVADSARGKAVVR